MTLVLPSDSEVQFVVSTDIAKLDFDWIHYFLSGSYWAKGIAREVVERSIRNSLLFGILGFRSKSGRLAMATNKGGKLSSHFL